MFTLDPALLPGRWDLTIEMDASNLLPAWLEIRKSGHRTLVGQFVSTHGSARPIQEVKLHGSDFSFIIPPQWEEGADDLMLTGQLVGEGLVGRIVFPHGEDYLFRGVRAPALRRATPASWGEPIQLFNGTDLAGWRAIQGENHWRVVDGILTNTRRGGNLVTEERFGDFQLHAEFRYPVRGNSGIYLRGRYEVQIIDMPRAEPASDVIGAIYGFLEPNAIVTHGPDAWHSYDITLVGRMVTIVLNGQTVISNQAIPGITGGALDSDEGAPGPLLLQGDHGPIEFRNLVLTPARPA
jgi:hypothetical protein